MSTQRPTAKRSWRSLNSSDFNPVSLLLLNFFLLAVLLFDSVASFAVASRGGGGRAPGTPDSISTTPDEGHESSSLSYKARASEPQEARLIVLQITDVYTLEHLASFKTLVEETRANAKGAKTICMLTGDFLSPYVLRLGLALVVCYANTVMIASRS